MKYVLFLYDCHGRLKMHHTMTDMKTVVIFKLDDLD